MGFEKRLRAAATSQAMVKQSIFVCVALLIVASSMAEVSFDENEIFTNNHYTCPFRIFEVATYASSKFFMDDLEQDLASYFSRSGEESSLSETNELTNILNRSFLGKHSSEVAKIDLEEMRLQIGLDFIALHEVQGGLVLEVSRLAEGRKLTLFIKLQIDSEEKVIKIGISRSIN